MEISNNLDAFISMRLYSGKKNDIYMTVLTFMKLLPADI